MHGEPHSGRARCPATFFQRRARQAAARSPESRSSTPGGTGARRSGHNPPQSCSRHGARATARPAAAARADPGAQITGDRLQQLRSGSGCTQDAQRAAQRPRTMPGHILPANEQTGRSGQAGKPQRHSGRRFSGIHAIILKSAVCAFCRIPKSPLFAKIRPFLPVFRLIFCRTVRNT